MRAVRAVRAVRTVQMENVGDIITLQGDAREPHAHFSDLVVPENDLAHTARHVVELLGSRNVVAFQGNARQTHVHVADVLVSEDDSRDTARRLVESWFFGCFHIWIFVFRFGIR